MASIRNYDRVPTTAPARRGRPSMPEDETLSYLVRIALTQKEYDAFIVFRKQNPLSRGESAAGRKIIVERLEAEGLLKSPKK